MVSCQPTPSLELQKPKLRGKLLYIFSEDYNSKITVLFLKKYDKLNFKGKNIFEATFFFYFFVIVKFALKIKKKNIELKSNGFIGVSLYSK